VGDERDVKGAEEGAEASSSGGAAFSGGGLLEAGPCGETRVWGDLSEARGGVGGVAAGQDDADEDAFGREWWRTEGVRCAVRSLLFEI